MTNYALEESSSEGSPIISSIFDGIEKVGGKAGETLVRDAGVAGVMGRTLHFLMGAYESARNHASVLGYDEIAEKLEEFSDENRAFAETFANFSANSSDRAQIAGEAKDEEESSLFGVDFKTPMRRFKKAVEENPELTRMMGTIALTVVLASIRTLLNRNKFQS